MEINVIKLAFLLSYLTMLVCLVSGVPFMTSLLRSLTLMVVFSATGLLLRWYLLRMISSLHVTPPSRAEPSEEWEAAEEELTETSLEPTEEKTEDFTLPAS